MISASCRCRRLIFVMVLSHMIVGDVRVGPVNVFDEGRQAHKKSMKDRARC
jgi:hypothetical protein